MGVLDKLLEHNLVLAGQTVSPGILAEQLFLFLVDVMADDSLVVAAVDGFLVLDEYETVLPMTDSARVALRRKGARLG